MDREKYLEEKLAEFQEYIVVPVANNKKKKVIPERFADIEAKTVDNMSSVLSFLNPEQYKEFFYEELEQESWQNACNFIYQEMLFHLIPGTFGGYDHCNAFYSVLASFACGAENIIERVYPYELGLTKNGYSLFVIGSNLIMAVYYKDEEMLEQAMVKADKFVNSKATKWDRNVIQFLVNILNKNFEEANKNLQDVCKGYGRLQNAQFIFSPTDFCLPAHGLYCIAEKWLLEEEFAQIKMPVHKSFSAGYASWRSENPDYVPGIYMKYPEEMDVVNKIYAMSVEKSVLYEHQWTERSKLELALDTDKMYQNFVEDLRKMKQI